MSDIQLSSEIPGLTPDQRNVILARQERRIAVLHEADISAHVNMAITNAIFNAGQRPIEEHELVIIVTRIIEELKNNYARFTIQEVVYAIALGSKEKFGEYANVSVRQIIRWLNAYDEQIRKEAIHKQREFEYKQEKLQKKRTEEEQIQAFHESIIKYYEEFKIGQAYDNVYLAANKFSYLNKIGKVNIEDLDMFDIDERVTKEYDSRKEAIPETFADKALAKMKGSDKYRESEIKTRIQAEALLVLFTNWKEQKYKLEL